MDSYDTLDSHNEVSTLIYPSLTFVNFSYVWQQQLCVRVMPLHIECDSVINDGLANYS